MAETVPECKDAVSILDQMPTIIHASTQAGEVDAPAGVNLRRAVMSDLAEGKVIWVRGRRCLCRRFEYPLVYWVSEGDDVEKHRSFSADPDMFAVEERCEPTPVEEMSTPVGVSPVDMGVPTPSETVTPALDETKASPASESPELLLSPTERPTPAANLIAAFRSRPARQVLIKGLPDGEEHVCDARMPQSLFIESCGAANIHVPAKVSALTIVGCINTVVRFNRVIAKLEVIRCTDVRVECSGSVETATIDESTNVELRFPITFAPESDGESPVDAKTLFLLVNSSAITLSAIDGDDSAETCSVSTPASSGDAPLQYQVVFESGRFSVPAVAEREGEGGYLRK